MSDWEPTDYDSMSRVYDAGRAMPEEGPCRRLKSTRCLKTVSTRAA